MKPAELAQRTDFNHGLLKISPSRRLIVGPAGELHVEPLIMQVLLLLLDARGQVVTRNQLFDKCWGGTIVGDDSLNRAITMVRRIASDTCPGVFEIENIPRTGYRLIDGDPGKASGRMDSANRRTALTLGLIASAGAGVLAWLVVARTDGVPLMAVSNPVGEPFSANLARSVSTAVGEQMTTSGSPFRLVEGGSSDNHNADFVLEVHGIKTVREAKAELTLFSGRDHALVWGSAMTQPVARVADLEQQVGKAGALVLACAAETQLVDGRRPDEEIVKLYLDACSRFDAMNGANLSVLTDAFEKVTDRAPQLRGAWSKLFLSKAEIIEGGNPPPGAVSGLRKNLADSRRHRVDVAETYIGQGALVPPNGHYRRLGLYEAGLARHPRSLHLLLARSWQLRSVGRMIQAILSARRAVQLNPQSVAARSEYISSLMYAGRIDAARRELDKAERIWPGAENLAGSRYRLEMRLGNPEAALRIIQLGSTIGGVEPTSFLLARQRPTKANIDRAVADEMAMYRADPEAFGSALQALGEFGRTEEAIKLLLDFKYPDKMGDGAELLFRPPLRGIRRDPRFIQIASRFGLTAYWTRSGKWPDFCSQPGLPYECAREASKYPG